MSTVSNKDMNTTETTKASTSSKNTINNGRNGQKMDTDGHCTTQKTTESNDWDLYPHVMRKIENEGTAKQVEHLHKLEHNKH
ncbi:MAG: hypothetical protein EXX96DRAFT_567667 [Benjaminiella poitrasii]|nr:MAG: hypothetical protein EXX96DRAFT_567667 [Benjaminiella poitrasii]